MQFCNCIEFSGIPKTINNYKLEKTIIEACKDVNIDVSETDIEAYKVNKVYVNPSQCPYYCYLWGHCKDLQRRNMIHHVFFVWEVLWQLN